MKNINTKLFFSMVILSVLSFTVCAKNLNILSLDDAVKIALKSNHDIQVKNYDYLESVQNVKLNNSSLLPKIGLSYTYNSADEARAGIEKDGTLSARATYNLFNGFKDISNKNSAKFLSKSSHFSLIALTQDIILNTKIAYINYLDKQNAVQTYKSAYNLFQEQYKDSKNRYEEGLIAKNDLLQVQVNMSIAKQNIVKALGDLKVTKYSLSNILGGIDLSNTDIKKLPDDKLLKSNYDVKLLENRSEIQALKMNIEAIKHQKKSVKSSYYPKLDASLSHNKYYEDISHFEDQNIASLSASWNLYNGGYDDAQGNIYRTRYLKAKTQLTKTKLNIKLQYENAISNLEVAIDNLSTAGLSLELATENYAIVKNRFDEGISSSTDLSDANYLLTQSKQGINRAYFDKYLAIATLHRIFEK